MFTIFPDYPHDRCFTSFACQRSEYDGNWFVLAAFAMPSEALRYVVDTCTAHHGYKPKQAVAISKWTADNNVHVEYNA